MKKITLKGKLVLITCLFLLTSNLFAQDPNFYIYLCFGQSNMEGQGPIESQDKTVNNRFKVFQALECPNLSRTKANWYTAVPPTCQCYSKLSPADYFGRTMVANLPDSITIGIINVAVGGCDIRLFDKDIYMDYDSTYTESWFTNKVKDYEWNPYQYLIDLAKLAQNDGVIKGILLHQGETNTGQVEWLSYVKKIYNDMLTDLSLNADSVPILAGELVSTDGNCCASMNPIIDRLPDTIPTAYVISSDGCTSQDVAHFNSEGYRKLGRRYALQMLSLLGYEAAYAEAECGTVGENWSTMSDNEASNSAFITAASGIENLTTAPSDDASSMQITLTADADTSYYLFGRFNNANDEENSFWLKIDDGSFELIDGLTTDGWEWLELKSLDLTAGEHIINIAIAEEGAKLDKLALKNSQSAPVDTGDFANNLCEAETVSGIGKISAKGFSLEQNYPNPVLENNTNISFEIPDMTYVSLKLYNSQGVEIDELAGKEYNPGKHTIVLYSEKLSPGIYFYNIQTDKFSATRKMVLSAN